MHILGVIFVRLFGQLQEMALTEISDKDGLNTTWYRTIQDSTLTASTTKGKQPHNTRFFVSFNKKAP